MFPIPANAMRIRWISPAQEQSGLSEAYIDADFVPTSSTQIYAKFFITSVYPNYVWYAFGRKTHNATSRCQISRSNSSTTPLDVGISGTAKDFAASDNTEYEITLDFASGSTTINGTTTTGFSVSSLGNYGVNIFTRQTSETNRRSDVVRLERLIFSEGGVAIRDFVPVRVGTVGYLFDRVSGNLFGNAGTGSFTLGPDCTYDAGVIPSRMMAMGASKVWPVAQLTGVSLVGSSVQNNGGILSGFTTSSYATMPFYWTSGALQIEAVVKFHWNGTNSTNSGIWGCVGSKDAFTPFYYETVNVDHMFGAYLSSNGTSWAINTSNGHWSIQNPPSGDYVLKLAWSEGTVKLYRWTGSAWVLDMTASIASIYGEANLVPQLGTNRGQGYPLDGTIDLNYTYLMRDGELWWEGAPGAYKRVAQLT